MVGAAWGGSEALWSQAVTHALRRGHEVLIAIDAALPPPQLDPLVNLGARAIGRSATSTRAWRAALEGSAPDAICVSQGAPFDVVVRDVGRPLVPWLTAMGPRVVNLVQFAREREHLSWWKRRAARALYSSAGVNATVCQRNAAAIAAALGLPGGLPRHVVVRNPVNLRDTCELPWPPCVTSEDSIRLACVARLSHRTKGQDTLLRALAGGPWRNRHWRLTLAGDGPDRELLLRMARQLGLEGRVDAPGQVADLRALWADHHLLVLPSRAEGTPLAMVEAMLLGRVCVASDVGGCGEWIQDGQSGFIAKPGEAGLVAALERAWAARARWPQIASAASARARALVDADPGATLLTLVESAGR